jgi:uncharacterized protein YbjT (DUF2867 family)
MMKVLLKIVGGFLLLFIGLAVWAMVTLTPNIPEDQFELRPPTVVGGLNVLVFGATGKLGTEIIEDLTARGDKVTAFVRDTSDRTKLEPLGVEFVVGDAMDIDSVIAAFNTSDFDAAISSLASMSANPPPDYVGNANVADGAKATGVQRVILISTVGAGDSKDAAPLLSKLALRKVLPLKTQAEDHLRASGLDYTIIRPGGLPPSGGTGGGILSEDTTTMGFIARADLARLVVGVLDDDRTIGTTLAAIDPARNAPWDDGQ